MFFSFTCVGVSRIVIPVGPYSTSVVGNTAFGTLPTAYFRKLPNFLFWRHWVSLILIFFFISIACLRRRRLSHVRSIVLSFFCIPQFHLSHVPFVSEIFGHFFSSPCANDLSCALIRSAIIRFTLFRFVFTLPFFSSAFSMCILLCLWDIQLLQ